MLDQMTFDLFAALQAEWRLRPPAHWLVAAFVGHTAPEEVQHMTPEAAAAMMQATGGRIDGLAPLR